MVHPYFNVLACVRVSVKKYFELLIIHSVALCLDK